jgi:hypothetical protein
MVLNNINNIFLILEKKYSLKVKKLHSNLRKSIAIANLELHFYYQSHYAYFYYLISYSFILYYLLMPTFHHS